MEINSHFVRKFISQFNIEILENRIQNFCIVASQKLLRIHWWIEYQNLTFLISIFHLTGPLYEIMSFYTYLMKPQSFEIYHVKAHALAVLIQKIAFWFIRYEVSYKERYELMEQPNIYNALATNYDSVVFYQMIRIAVNSTTTLCTKETSGFSSKSTRLFIRRRRARTK